MRTDVLIPAGGKGIRSGYNIPKQYIKNGKGETVIERTVWSFRQIEEVDNIVVVVKEKNDITDKLEKKYSAKIIEKAGDYREETVFNGLEYIKSDYVLIHDAARPYINPFLIKKLVLLLKENDVVIPYLKVRDTIVDEKGMPVKRDKLKIIQTPQCFRTSLIKEWIKKLYEEGKLQDFTDESTIARYFNYEIHFVEGDYKNKKITYKEDVEEWMSSSRLRVGYGYDIHRFGSGKKLILGGVEVPYEKGLIAHSDGDVIVHALMDAILGAVGEKDIGAWFPPSDDKWKDYSSVEMLKIILKKTGVNVVNVDCMVRCKEPKLSKYRDKMIETLENVLNAPVNIKATTDEGLGEIGKGEGIAVHCVVMVEI